MGAHHQRCLAIGGKTKCCFFRSCFTVDVDHKSIGITDKFDLIKQLLETCKNIICFGHEKICHHIGNSKPLACSIADDDNTLARCVFDHVIRAQQAWLGIYIGNDLTLVPDMIAGCQHICTGGEERIGNVRSDTKAAGGIFNIDDNEISGQFFTQVRHGGDHLLAGHAADNITQKKNTHQAFSSCDPGCSNPSGVSTASRRASCGPVGTLATSCSA